MSRRLASIALLVGSVVVGTAGAASAHAVVRSSSPVNGAVVSQAPNKVTIMFTERPDPKLSTVEVLNSSGRNVAEGDAQAVSGDPFGLTVRLGSVPDGVFTVTWRTVSEADGHTTAGSFSFGVGNVSPAQVRSSGGGGSVVKTPSPPPLAVAGRWGLYWGLAVLFSAAVAYFWVFGGALPLRRGALLVGWGLAALGLIGMIAAERSSAGVSFSELFSSTSGHHLLREVGALGVAAVAVVLALALRGAWAVALVGLAAAGSMFVHALNSHAAASSPVWFNVGDQWVHLMAVGAWVGGLVWLLLALRDHEGEERTTYARRFSWLAGITLAVVSATGIIRAIDEVGPPQDWGRLFTTSFGVTLLVKLGLFAALIVFAARNRYVNVPGLTEGTRRVGSLRRTVAAEVAIAAGILGATAVLSELPPSATVAQAKPAPSSAQQVVVTGHDFATSVRARLAVTPGTVGPNDFEASVLDFDTGKPVDATDVSLAFSLPSHPDMGQQTLDLQQRGDRWVGSGTVLSMFGRWNLTMTVQEPSGGVEVPFRLQTALPPQEPPVVSAQQGQPTVSTVTLPNGASMQGYADPGDAGRNTVHFTFFQASGNELAIASASAVEITPSGSSRPLHLIRFDKGHFVANVTLRSGRWTFLIDAAPRTGIPFSAWFKPIIGSQGGS